MNKKKAPKPKTPQPDPGPPQVAPGAYHDSPFKCVRCQQPVKMTATPSFSRILVIQCVHCSNRIDIEMMRETMKKLHLVQPPEEETLDPEE